jgi:hypothetical protein
MADIDDEKEGGSGSKSGGSSGRIEYVDFMAPGSGEPEVPLHLKLEEHSNKILPLIEQQLQDRQQISKLKSGVAQGYQAGSYGHSQEFSFEIHPAFANSQAMDGADPKATMEANELDAPNKEKQEELTYQHQLRNEKTNKLMYTPKLTR